MTPLFVSLSLAVLALLVALLPKRFRSASSVVMALSALSLWAVLANLSTPATYIPLWLLGSLPLGLYLDPLARIFMVILASGFTVFLFAAAESGTQRQAVARSLLFIGALLTVAAGTAATFLLAWELMGFAAYLAASRHPTAAYRMIGTLGVGALLLYAAFAILGTGPFPELLDHPGGGAWVFVLSLAGFGAKLGLLPLGGWYPRVYQKSSGSATALYSGAVWAAAVYGLMRFMLGFIEPVLAFGIVLLALGVLSGLYGALSALVEPDLKRLLAFSTLENGGVLTMVLGTALVFKTQGQPALAGLGILLVLYLSLHHVLAKSLALLATGSAEAHTGSSHLDRLGGLSRRLPFTTLGASVGLLSLAALPPSSGFVAEWLVFQLVFQEFHLAHSSVRLALIGAGALFALISGFTLVAALKALGVGFLGRSRSPYPGEMNESFMQKAALGLGALLSFGVGLVPLVVVPWFNTAQENWSGLSLAHLVTRDNLQINPVYQSFSAMSSTALWLFIPAVALLVAVIFGSRRRRATEPWVAGSGETHPRIQVSGTGFTNALRLAFAAFYRPVWLRSPGRYAALVYDHLEAPVPFFNRMLGWLASTVARIQSGHVTLYTLYILVVFLVGLIWFSVAFGH